MTYDDAEISICVEYDNFDGTTTQGSLGDSGEEAQEQAENEIAAGMAVSWCYTVYWHRKEGGVEWVADFEPERRTEAFRAYFAMCSAAALAKDELLSARFFAQEAVG